jgi:N-methylhydantoinase B
VAFPNGKLDSFPLQRGDRYVVDVGGGGGVGNPLERPLEMVLADVRSGYVSVEAARRDYGVVIVPSDGGELAVDEAASAALRGGGSSGSTP